MAKATINGVEIAYTDAGQGTPVVFIHGFPLTRQMWESQVEALSGRARCITIDLRSHGESQSVLWYATVDTYADEVAALLDHLGIERAVVCGFSMGGYVAFAFLRRYRERVAGLILADTRPQADTPEGKQGRFNTAQTAHTQGAKAIADAMLPRLLTEKTLAERPEVVSFVRSMIEGNPVVGMAADLMAMAQRPDSVEMLEQIRVPTLIIVGNQDALTPPADSELMASKIPGAKLVRIEGAAHLSNLEQPAAFNAAVAEFLERLS